MIVITTVDQNIKEIKSYLSSLRSRLALQDNRLENECKWDNNCYDDIISCCVKGRVFNGTAETEQDTPKQDIDIGFIRALMAVQEPKRLFHPCGIAVENVNFVSGVASEREFPRFDLAGSRFPLPVKLHHCDFSQPLDLRRAHLASLDLSGDPPEESDPPKQGVPWKKPPGSTLPALMLEGAHIEGPLILDNTHLWFDKKFVEAAEKRDPHAPHAGLDANDLVTTAHLSDHEKWLGRAPRAILSTLQRSA